MARRRNSRRRAARKARDDQTISESKGRRRRRRRTSQLAGLRRTREVPPVVKRGREIVPYNKFQGGSGPPLVPGGGQLATTEGVPAGNEIVRRRGSRAVRAGGPRVGPTGTVIPQTTALALNRGIPANVTAPARTAKVAGAPAAKFLEATLGKTWAPIVKGAGVGALALFELMRLRSSAAEGSKRRKQLAALRSAPKVTAQAVLRDRRRGQLLAARRAKLAQTDPEAYRMLIQAVSGDVPPRLARGEILLGRQPQVSPTASQDIDALLEMLG